MNYDHSKSDTKSICLLSYLYHSLQTNYWRYLWCVLCLNIMLVTVCVSNSSALSEDDCKGLYGTYSRACNANNMDYIFSGIEDRHFDATWKQFSWIQFDNLCSNSVWYNKAHVNYPIFKSKVCRINEFEKYLLEWAANENIKTNGKFDIKTFAVKIRKESATKATVIFNTKETSNEITRKFTNINGKWAQVK